MSTCQILTRVHRMADFLPRIASQIDHLGASVPVIWTVRVDRPSPDVEEALHKLETWAPCAQVDVFAAGPVVVEGVGMRWAESLEEMLGRHRTAVGMVWDDDMLYSPRALEEVRNRLHTVPPPRLEVMCHTMWNSTHYAPQFRNRITAAFRRYPGDHFDPALTSHCPRSIAHLGKRDPRFVQMRFPMLHYGYASPEARAHYWELYRTMGRIDPYTAGLTDEPLLKKVPPDDLP